MGKVHIEPLQFFWGHLGDQAPKRHDLGFGGHLEERNGYSKMCRRKATYVLGHRQPRTFYRQPSQRPSHHHSYPDHLEPGTPLVSV